MSDIDAIAEDLAAANMRDAKEFCQIAFGPFGVDIGPYAVIVAKLMKRATDRGLDAASALYKRSRS